MNHQLSHTFCIRISYSSSNPSVSNTVNSILGTQKKEPTLCLKTAVVRTRQINIYLTHVSGEYWLLCLALGEAMEEIEMGKAQFRIGKEGQVEEVGFEMEGKTRFSKKNEMVWLKRERPLKTV